MTTKKAIGYVRISTKDQSNFSLDGQEEYIIKFCEKQSWQVLTIFKDDGQSAKNFDRPDWKDLENFVKRNHANVDFLIVSKYDRFSRNVSEALQMIELLEQRYNIRVMSVMEPIMLHPSSPYFFQFRTQMLLGAQVEWMVIRDRTKAGNHQAAKSGRYICGAPFGYKNARDERNKPILVIDERRARIIKDIYEKFLGGYNMAQLKELASTIGYGNKGNSAIKRLLTNPTYGGLVRVPEYYDEAEKLIKGIHEGIVSESAWWKVQAMLNNKPAMVRTVINDAVPLRGKLKCFCGRNVTAAKSKGKKIYVWYYFCKSHREFNINANRLHAQVEDIFGELSMPDHYIDYLQEKIIEKTTAKIHSDTIEIKETQSQVNDLVRKLDNVEEKYLQGDIDRETFRKWQTRYYQEKSVLEEKLQYYKEPVGEQWEKHHNALNLLKDLRFIYQKANTEQKMAMVGWVFDHKLYYEGGVCRTPFIQPLFTPKAASLHEKRLLIYEQPLQKVPEISGCTRDVASVEPLNQFLVLISEVKTA